MMNTTGRILASALAGLCLFAAGCGERTVATPSGVKYADLVVGKGAEAKSGDFIVVHALGWVEADETRFEDTYEFKKPHTLRLGTVENVKGWDDGIPGMKVGGKRKLYVPSLLGFGAQGHGLLCPPNSDLVYEIELLRVIDGFKAEDLEEGKGKTAKWLDIVELRYTGALADGSLKFDSYKDVAPFLPTIFQLGQRDVQQNPVPRGWEGGIIGMKEGGKRKLNIPAELGYGSRGWPPRVPPDADLIVEVELVKIHSRFGEDPAP